jgi:hypothetical protein
LPIVIEDILPTILSLIPLVLGDDDGDESDLLLSVVDLGL